MAGSKSTSVEAMVASLTAQLEGIDVQALAKQIASRPGGEGEMAINSFGTAGTAGTLSGCFGTAGTFGSLGAQEISDARK